MDNTEVFISEAVMGMGVGEAILLSAASGAAAGGVGSLLAGEDPLHGVLTGGLMGGVTGGIGGALGGAPAGAAAGGSGTSAGQAAIQASSQMPGLANASLAPGVASASTPMMPVTGSAATPLAGASAGNPEVGFMDIFKPEAGSAVADMGMGERLGNYIIQNPVGAGMGGATIGGMFGGLGVPNPMNEEDEYDGPLSQFRYSPNRFRPSFAQGGLADTQEAELFLRGPGDGMSDDIPAMIEGEQPASLSDGEFVIPADVVSGLGNGSTDAGARQLYEMIDRVRKARTGHTDQGKEIDPQEHLEFASGGQVGDNTNLMRFLAGDMTALYPDADQTKLRRFQEMGGFRAPYSYTGGDPGGHDMGPGVFGVSQGGVDNSAMLSLLANNMGGARERPAAHDIDIEAAKSALRERPEYQAQVDYTRTVRPNFQEFGPNGQFYQPVYQPTYTDYRNLPQGIDALEERKE